MESVSPTARTSITLSSALPASSARVPAHRRHAAGEIIAGRYQLVSPLGEGGMGTVWRAHCLALDVDVALKVLHREHSNPTAAARLLREARATACLAHPAIVRTLDFGQMETGEPFLVMELLEGASLADWIDERGRLSPALALQILLPVASALSAAHAHGIIHRDVKPENILVVPGEPGTYQPKVVDFGIAKVAADPTEGKLTETGAVLGSLVYMSPEQADGRRVGVHTDVWGFCVMLYELLTGHRLFQATTLIGMIHALLTCAPTPTTEYAVGDDALWAIIERGLRKSPENRWPSMHELGCALASWAIERGIEADATGALLSRTWQLAEPAAPAPSSDGAALITSPPSASVLFPSQATLDIPPPGPAAAEPASSAAAEAGRSPSKGRRFQWRRAAHALSAVAILLPLVAWLGVHGERAPVRGLGAQEPRLALIAPAPIGVQPGCGGPGETCPTREAARTPAREGARAGDGPAALPAEGPDLADVAAQAVPTSEALSPRPPAPVPAVPGTRRSHLRAMPLPSTPNY